MHPSRVTTLLPAALDIRRPLLDSTDVSVYRLVDGSGDRLEGLYLDRYGPAAVISVYDDAALDDEALTMVSGVALEQLAPFGVESIYVKRFMRDRSRLGGQAPAETRAAVPRAGVPQPETMVVREYGSRFEVRLYDGFSTGLFLEHREHRRSLAQLGARRALNLFAYTCAFAVPLVASGAHVSNVDVSSRYLAWGRRNLEVNGLPADRARFSRMDAFAYLAWAAKRPAERYDLVVLDPPTFAAGDAREKRRAWKAVSDYPALVRAAVEVLAPGGRIFAASNTRELASAGALARIVEGAIGRERLRWEPLPPWPIDVREPGRVDAVLFSVAR
ncbi:MAG: class I SAM-dependent rRNA methyltransferase [Vicinamibacterales bacterium]